MRLIKLKLSGFKSFVDPTTILFPSELIGVVGPNGCGKSNIIDAVNWVLGESSAKQLRGDSMADVIFNGSSQRKPVGQASVELIFDNSDSSITGEFASYTEISIRRVVSRDGQSNYYLNGQRCRRKDITDLFLGTGLGPRSYSVIGQGMIARILEAKPEEIRDYLEEAAGISKYKERRRETENRIRHTKENLERLNDISSEQEKTLSRLNRQAKVAERYKVYCEEQKQLKVKSLGHRWQQINTDLQAKDRHITEQDVILESQVAKQRHIDTELEKLHVEQDERNTHFNTMQQRYFQSEKGIIRIQEAITHQKQRVEQLQEDKQQANQDLQTIKNDYAQEQAIINECEKTIARLTPEAEEKNAIAKQSQDQLENLEARRQACQKEWDTLNLSASESAQMAQVSQTKIQHIEQHVKQAKERLQRLQEEKAQLQMKPLNEQIEHYEKHIATLQADEKTQCDILENMTTRIRTQRSQNEINVSDLDDAKQQLGDAQSRYTSLNVLQQAALGQQEKPIVDWLKQHNLDSKKRLAECIEVEAGWEKAVEVCLGSILQAVMVDDMAPLTLQTDAYPEGNLCFVKQEKTAERKESVKQQTLNSKLKTFIPAIDAFLSRIYIADDITQAFELLKTLSKYETVITRDGVCVGYDYLTVHREGDDQVGVLERQQQLQQLVDDMDALKQTVEKAAQTVQEGLRALEQLEMERDTQQAACAEIARQVAEERTRLQVAHTRLEQMQKRVDAIEKDYAECQKQIKEDEISYQDIRQTWHDAMMCVDQHATEREALKKSREAIDEQLLKARQESKNAWDVVKSCDVQLQSNRVRYTALQESLDKEKRRIDELTARCKKLDDALSACEAPQQSSQQELKHALEQHAVIEKTLNEARQAVESVTQSMHSLEKQRSDVDEESRVLQHQCEQLRMNAQELRVRCTTVQEQLAEMDYTIDVVKQMIEEESDEINYDDALEQIANKITRLGAINLAAVEEYQIELERKTYLDEQYNDLVTALDTLENAIAKIDRETKMLFKETYEKVNQSFSALFPKLFGGGQASLELNSDDLLNTGVYVNARPPGKRNTRIHLLSGGEKALTAVALIFSIFQLNPSPFCMLDEVDAPLDDFNVGRFCNVVKSMSDKVQFIVITHNKITMEMTKHLMGVTMHEPGVSRLVSVNIEEAVNLAVV